VEGEHADRVVWHDVWLSDAALPMAKRDLGKLGITSLEQPECHLPERIVGDTGMADLSRAELSVWLILYRDTKRDGTARASLDDLARRRATDRQTASRGVGRLARRKMLRGGGLNCGPLK
jgi:hypothetical protein